MVNTSKHGFTYPAGTETVKVQASKILADQIDLKIDRYRASTGAKVLHTMGMYEEKAPNLPGWIVVMTDIPYAVGNGFDKMVRFDVRGYTYWPYNNIVDFSINTYLLNGGLFSPDFHNRGTTQIKDLRILRYNLSGAERLAFAFKCDNPAGGDVWQYPKIIVDGYVSWATEIPDAQFTQVSVSRNADIMNPQNPQFTSIHKFIQNEWQPLGLANGWYQYDGGGTAGHAYARYKRVGEQVYIEGLVVGGPLTSDISSVPPGYRHTGGPLIFHVHTNGGNGRVDVHSNGAIVANGVPGNAYVSLNGITYSVGNGG